MKVIIVILIITIYLILNRSEPYSPIIHTDIETLCKAMAKNSTDDVLRAWKSEAELYNIVETAYNDECVRMLRP